MTTLIRKAVDSDIPKLLSLMRELAVFEKYDAAFAITEEILREQGFRRRRLIFSVSSQNRTTT